MDGFTFFGCSADKMGVRKVERCLQFELLCNHILHPIAGVDVEPAETAIIFTGNTSLEIWYGTGSSPQVKVVIHLCTHLCCIEDVQTFKLLVLGMRGLSVVAITLFGKLKYYSIYRK